MPTANPYFVGANGLGAAGGPLLPTPSGTTQIPVFDASGNIKGYQSLNTATQPTAYSTTPQDNQTGLLTNTPSLNGRALNTLGPVLNLGSGVAPNSGSTGFNPGGTGTSFTNTPNPNSQFSLLQQTKNPAIASSAASTLGTENNLAGTESQNFNQYLAAAQKAVGLATSDVGKDTTTLQALPGQEAASLNATNNQYATAANNANTQYQNLNTNQAATNAADVAQLGNLDTQYVTNSENALALQLAQAGGAINARSINPNGSNNANSDYNQSVLTTEAQAALGLQQNLSNMQINQLTGYVTPLQQQQYQGNVNQTQFGNQVAQTIAGMQTGSAEQIAALTQAVAGRPAAEAQQLLSSLGLPLNVQQQVMSSLPQSLNALTSIDNSNNIYGVSALNSNGTINAGAGFTTPNTSTGGVYTSPNVQRGTQPMGATIAPTISPTNPYLTAATGAPLTGATAAPLQYGTPAYYQQLAQLQNNNLLAQSGYTVDPITGQLVNPNAATGGGSGGAYAGGSYFPAGTGSGGSSGAVAGGQYFPAGNNNYDPNAQYQ